MASMTFPDNKASALLMKTSTKGITSEPDATIAISEASAGWTYLSGGRRGGGRNLTGAPTSRAVSAVTPSASCYWAFGPHLKVTATPCTLRALNGHCINSAS